MIDGLVPAPQALKLVLDGAGPTLSETIPLDQSNGRVLARDVQSLRTQPPFDACAMDGYGVRQQDIASLPARLHLIGQSAAGHPFAAEIGEGQAVRIFTGAAVPEGVDTIIIQENTHSDGEFVEVLEPCLAGKFIRKSGLDFSKGETLLLKHQVLNPQSIALAASMNHGQLEVWRKPIAAIIATGDELVLPGQPLEEGQIIASNSYGLMAMCTQAGAETVDMGIARDTVESLKKLTRQALDQGADVIVTMGGASVGDHDLVLPTMREIGFEFEFTKIAMKPGKPCLFAKMRFQNRTVYLMGLAGNPVSSIIAGQIFVRPLINALAGLPPELAMPVPAIIGGDLPANDARQEFMRATLSTENGKNIAIPFKNQDSSMLARLTKADCLVIRAINAPAAKTGDACEIVIL